MGITIITVGGREYTVEFRTSKECEKFKQALEEQMKKVREENG